MSKTIQAIVREGKQWLSATVRQAGDTVEVLSCDTWSTRHSSGARTESVSQHAESTGSASETVYGFVSGGVAFHRIEVPHTRDSEMDALVSL